MSATPTARDEPDWRHLAFGEPADAGVAAQRLRPLGFAEIIDVPFATLRRHAGRVLVILAVAAVLPLLAVGRWAAAMTAWMADFQSAFEGAFPAPGGPEPPTMSDAEALGWLIALLVGGTLLMVGTTRVLLADQIGVRLPAVAAMTRRPLRLLAVVGWMLLAWLVATPVMFVAFALVAAVAALVPPLLVLVVPGAAALGVYVLGAVGLGPVVAAAEHGGPLRAFGRAFALSRGARFRLGGIFLAVSVVGTLVVYALLGLLNLVGLATLGLEGPDATMAVLGVVGGVAYVLGLALVTPVSVMASAAAYLDRLVRHDGVDVLAVLAAQREGAGPAPR